MSKPRSCKKSQANEKQDKEWYDLVNNVDPEMKSYFHKMLARIYLLILPNNFTLLPKLDGFNGYNLIQKNLVNFSFVPNVESMQLCKI